MKPLTFFALLALCPAVFADQTRSIKVTAKSEIKVAPNEIILELAVHTRDQALLAAKRKNDTISAALLAVARKHSISAGDIKTTDLDVSPDYGRWDRKETTPIAYDFTRSIEVRLTDFSKVEPFLSDAFEAGLNDVARLHFRVSNQRQHQFEARKLAMTHAREKAEHLTELTGMKLGLPIRIEEDVEENPDAVGFGGVGLGLKLPIRKDDKYVASKRPRFFETSFQKDDDKNDDGTAALTAPGQIVISAQVTVEFEMSSK